MALSVSSDSGSLPDPRALDYDSLHAFSGLTLVQAASGSTNRDILYYEWTATANGWAIFRGNVVVGDSVPVSTKVELYVKQSGGTYICISQVLIPSSSFSGRVQLECPVCAGFVYRFTFYSIATNLTKPTNTMTTPQVVLFPYLAE